MVRGKLTANVEFVDKFGRPPKERRWYKAQKRSERQEASERNAIEGKIGEAKRRYGLNRVIPRRSSTSASVIHLILIVMNLKKSLRDLLLTFFDYVNEVSVCGLTKNTLLGSSP